jgi:hypothetical protein
MKLSTESHAKVQIDEQGLVVYYTKAELLVFELNLPDQLSFYRSDASLCDNRGVWFRPPDGEDT